MLGSRLLSAVAALSCALLASASPSRLLPRAGSLERVQNFGANPANVPMYIYVPRALASSPGIVVAIHYCTGSAQAYYSGSPYAQLAEKHGFIVIYPSSPYSGSCWDVSSKKTLTHNGGGDSNSIANMVTWTINQYKANAARVYVTGSSSGAMMTNVMAATYPNLFKAASAYSGVAAGCFMSTSGGVAAWNDTCAKGNARGTPAYWGGVALNMDPGYTGERPKMVIYHGGADKTIYPQNYYEACKQWSGVLGYNYDKPNGTVQNSPSNGYTRTVFGPKLEGVFNPNVGHSVPIMGNEDMKLFGYA